MEAKEFINKIDSTTYRRLRDSSGDAECRRLLKELLQQIDK